jgi:hypothetical protein
VLTKLQTLPLEQYQGHDIVLWGERKLVKAGDIQGACNVHPKCCADVQSVHSS